MVGGRRQSGYTLIEILIVLVVLSVIASIALASYWSTLDRSKQRATMADMRTISKAIEVYQTDHGLPPPDTGGMAFLQALLIPYQTTVLPMQDHWSHDYVYTADAATGNYTVESYGKDGVDGANITQSTRFQFDADIVLTNGQFVASPE